MEHHNLSSISDYLNIALCLGLIRFNYTVTKFHNEIVSFIYLPRRSAHSSCRKLDQVLLYLHPQGVRHRCADLRCDAQQSIKLTSATIFLIN